jgi:RimJ/RimL family protein N-acetyltransferase
MNIRIAENEADSISASYIYAMSWKVGYKGILSETTLEDLSADQWVKFFNENYKTKRFEIAIMNIDGEDVGAGGYGLSRDYEGMGEITSIYFLPETWGKGYSQKLMDFIVDRINEMDYHKIHVCVLEENVRARRFYEKYGFALSDGKKTITIKGEDKEYVEYTIEVKD